MRKNAFRLPSLYPSQPRRDTRRAFTQTQKNEVALCSDCHDKVTHAERLKQVDKKEEQKQIFLGFRKLNFHKNIFNVADLNFVDQFF